MTSSEDRWTYPADGEDPRDIDAETQDPTQMSKRQQTRHVSHDADDEAGGESGLSSDSPGANPADRDQVDEITRAD